MASDNEERADRVSDGDDRENRERGERERERLQVELQIQQRDDRLEDRLTSYVDLMLSKQAEENSDLA